MSDTDPRLEGYTHWHGIDNFEDFVGPLYFKREDEEEVRCAFIVGEQHVNGQKGLHGGMMMTFADYAMFVIAQNKMDGQHAVTISFNSEFVARAELGDLVFCTGEIVRETGRLIFMRGQVFTDEGTVLAFSAVLKKVGERKG